MQKKRISIVNLNAILIGLEAVLSISVNEPIERQIELSVQELEAQWRVQLGSATIFELREENNLAAEPIDKFIANVLTSLQGLCYLLSANMFYEDYGQTLKDLNYLGFDRDRLASSMQYLMRQTTYHNRTQFFESIVTAASRQDSCDIRRLICIMAVLEHIGFAEAVGIIAEYLYVGIKVK